MNEYISYNNIVEFSTLKGKVFTNVYKSEFNSQDFIIFENDTEKYIMTHDQDCCESVYIESIVGCLDDLIGTEILIANESGNTGVEDDGHDTFTWTFYNLATIKGYVDIRWYGSSNGYYSERVDLYRIK